MTHKEIQNICRKYSITNYTINRDGSIDVDGDVNLSHIILTKLPIKFNKVTGHFDCSFNRLETLEGAPNKVGGNFDFFSNKLTSLKGSPIEVGGYFNCAFNKLTNLGGVTLKIGGEFDCDYNHIDLNYDKYLKKTKRISKLSQL